MDAVKTFNSELSALYELKPPISKAKMTSITKSAIKAIKFYKHVVQSVEKFIQKCRPEYKIPGLYVIDSIVRQSRHQFGIDKDVFAPRFAKNAQYTFYHLYKCCEDEKSRVIRVLNLWQKNEVFPSDVVQPLFDMANPNSEVYLRLDEQIKSSGGKPPKSASILSAADSNKSAMKSDSSKETTGSSPIDREMAQQLQTILQLLKNHVGGSNSSSDNVKFNKKLLDFDYSDDEDNMDISDSAAAGPNPQMLEALQGILGNPMVLSKLKGVGAITDHQIQQLQQLVPQAQQQQQQQQHIQHNSLFGNPPPVQQDSGGIEILYQQQPPQNNPFSQPANTSLWGAPPPMGGVGPPLNGSSGGGRGGGGGGRESPLEEGERDGTDEDIQIVEDHHMGAGGVSQGWGASSRARGQADRRRRSRSRDRDGSRRGRRSRSRSRDRRSGGGRRRSRSPRDRSSRDDRSTRDREDREKKREREKKGLPPIRKGFLSVCSTTLWVGHLSKLVAEDDLSDMFGEIGTVETIHLIPPRGCAYVCMNRRQDAYKALKTLNKKKLHMKPCTIAWAPGKGMKDKQWKDFWDVELGVLYIPIDKLDPQVDMISLEAGGTFDEETMPEWMKTMRGVAPHNMGVAQAGGGNNIPGPAFIPVPEGVPQPNMGGLMGSGDIPLPGGGMPGGNGAPPTTMPPPGMPPFGLPPSGILNPAAALAAGILPPGGLIGGPTNILMGAPLTQGLPPGPPPGFPPPGGFDASQPPPGIRLPFGAPPPQGGAGLMGMGPPNMGPPGGNQPPPMGDMNNMPPQGGNNMPMNMDMDMDGDGPPQDGGPDLVSRLRNLAGGPNGPGGPHGPGGPGGPPGGGPNGGPGGPGDNGPGMMNHDGPRRGPFNDGPPGPFGGPNDGPFNRGGPFNDGPPFDGPPFDGGPPFNDGPNGGFNVGPPFGGGFGGPGPDGPFMDGPFRGGPRGGGPRGGWRGRGGPPPMRGGRGGFGGPDGWRDGPPFGGPPDGNFDGNFDGPPGMRGGGNNWNDRGGRGGPPHRGGPPPRGGARDDFPRGGPPPRGGDGLLPTPKKGDMPPPAAKGATPTPADGATGEKPAKKERKSRWGNFNFEKTVIQIKKDKLEAQGIRVAEEDTPVPAPLMETPVSEPEALADDQPSHDPPQEEHKADEPQGMSLYDDEPEMAPKDAAFESSSQEPETHNEEQVEESAHVEDNPVQDEAAQPEPAQSQPAHEEHVSAHEERAPDAAFESSQEPETHQEVEEAPAEEQFEESAHVEDEPVQDETAPHESVQEEHAQEERVQDEPVQDEPVQDEPAQDDPAPEEPVQEDGC